MGLYDNLPPLSEQPSVTPSSGLYDNHPPLSEDPNYLHGNMNTEGAIPPTTPRPPLSTMDTIKGALLHSKQSVLNLAKNIVATYEHPVDTYNSLIGRLPGIPAIEGVVNTVPDAAKGALLNSLSPDVRAMVIGQTSPDNQNHLNAASKTASGAGNAVINAGKAFTDYTKNRWLSRPGEETGTAAKYTMMNDPIGAAADAATLLMGAGGVARGVASAVPSVTARAVAGAAAPTLEGVASVVNPIYNAGRLVRAIAGKLGISDPAGVMANRLIDAIVPAPATAGRWLPGLESAAQNAMITDALEGQAPAIQQALRGGAAQNAMGTNAVRRTPIVNGSVPTAGQAIAGEMNATRLLALDKTAGQNLSTELANIKDTQNEARLNQVRGIGGDRTSAELMAEREADAEENYADAGVSRDPVNNPVPTRLIRSNPELMSLFSRDVMPDVFEEARKIASNQGRDFQIGQNVPANQTVSSILDQYGIPTQINNPAQFAQYSAQDLHTVKQAFDALAYKKAQEFGLSAAQSRAVQDARGAFLNWFETQNPEYRTARTQYGRQSSIVDRKRIGEYMEGVLTGNLHGEDAPLLRADAYANAIDGPQNAAIINSTLRKATGQQRQTRLGDVLQPGEMASLQNVGNDLSRAKQAEVQARLGSIHASNLNTAASDMVGGLVPPIARPVINYLMGNMDNRIADRVGRASLTPTTMNAMINDTLARETSLYRLRQGTNAIYNHTVGRLNQYPAVYNVIQQKRDEKNK